MYILYMGGFRVSELGGGGGGKGRLSFDDVFVPCTLTVVAKWQSCMAAMTVNYIKICK